MEQIAYTLAYLGVSPPDVFAGFCGSIVHVSAFGTKPGKILLTMTANTILANYLGVVAGMYVGMTGGHIGALLVGFSGMVLVKKIMDRKFPGFFDGLDKKEPANGQP